MIIREATAEDLRGVPSLYAQPELDGAHALYDGLGFERHGYSFQVSP